MGLVQKDILRLMIDKASFVGGSKRRQLGFDQTLKLAMLHDSTSEAISWEVSDDSLQVLIAGNQNITGIKTFTAPAVFENALGATFGAAGFAGAVRSNGTNFEIKSLSNVPLILDTVSEPIDINFAGTLVAQVEAGVFEMQDNTTLKVGNTGGALNMSYSFPNVLLTALSSNIKIETSGPGAIELNTNITGLVFSHIGVPQLKVNSSGVVVQPGIGFQVGSSYDATIPTIDGQIAIKDAAGNVLLLACEKFITPP